MPNVRSLRDDHLATPDLLDMILDGPGSSRKRVSEAAEVSSTTEQPHDQNDDQDGSEYSADAITTTAGVVATAIISESAAKEKYKQNNYEDQFHGNTPSLASTLITREHTEQHALLAFLSQTSPDESAKRDCVSVIGDLAAMWPSPSPSSVRTTGEGTVVDILLGIVRAVFGDRPIPVQTYLSLPPSEAISVRPAAWPERCAADRASGVTIVRGAAVALASREQAHRRPAATVGKTPISRPGQAAGS